MAEIDSSFAHRVYLKQALGADEHLRVTFHEDQRVVVFSHWSGERCLAATPVRVTDTPELATLLVQSLAHAASHPVAHPVAPPAAPIAEPRWRHLMARLLGRHVGQTDSSVGPEPQAAVVPLRWRDDSVA